MTPAQAEVLTAAALAVVLVITIPAYMRLTIAIADGRPLWEPQWKREARELARYIPTGDEWGR